jgi:hypothetical protein
MTATRLNACRSIGELLGPVDLSCWIVFLNACSNLGDDLCALGVQHSPRRDLDLSQPQLSCPAVKVLSA